MKKWFVSLFTLLQIVGTVVADAYPTREIKVVVSLAFGGGIDIITRALTDLMKTKMGQLFIVDNKGGVGTRIGMQVVASSLFDGHTVVVNGDMVAIFEFIFVNMKFDVQKDFVLVTYFASALIVLAAYLMFQVINVKELIEMVNRSLGQVNYATLGVGIPHDLVGLLMMQKVGIKLNLITYKGNGLVLVDLLAGYVQIGMFMIFNVFLYVQTGKLKALAVVGDQRTKIAFEILSMGELGLLGVDVSSRYVMLVPTGMLLVVIAKLHAVIAETVKKFEMVQVFNKFGYEPMSISQQEAASMLKVERECWQFVLKVVNIKLE